MIKLIGLLKKKPGLSRQEFIDYYENHHAPLACRLLPMGKDYRRSYPTKMRMNGKETNDAFEYDVVTEVWFEDAAAYQAFNAAMSRPEVLAEVIADEERFLDRANNRIMITEEHHSPR